VTTTVVVPAGVDGTVHSVVAVTSPTAFYGHVGFCVHTAVEPSTTVSIGHGTGVMVAGTCVNATARIGAVVPG
jgi:hypothetical protein